MGMGDQEWGGWFCGCEVVIDDLCSGFNFGLV